MQARNLRYFKTTLTAQLDNLRRQENQVVKELLASGSRAPDSVDQATNEAGLAFTLRIREREFRLIRKTQEALARIEEGTFGICEQCGEEITLKRLKARPVTTHCIACKSRLEARERVIESARGMPQGFMRAGNE